MKLTEHLLERRLIAENYNIWLDEQERVVTLPLFNLSSQLVGYQQYRPDVLEKKSNHPKESRYFSYLPRQVTGIWGLETIRKDIPFIFVQEGIFDACPFHMLGLPAVAILSCDNKQAILNLKMMNKRLLTLADRDTAGQRMLNKVHGGMLVPEPYKDVGDMPLDVLKQVTQSILSII